MNETKKANMMVLTLDVVALLVPSFLMGIVGLLWKGMFILPFLSTFAASWILGQISNVYFHQKADVEIEKLKLQEMEIIGQQSVDVNCSFCQKRNMVPVRLNMRNTFKCIHCEQQNLMVFQFATAQITTPLTLPQLGASVNGQFETP